MNGPFTASQMQQWQQNGFLKLPALLSGEKLQQFCSWVDEVANWPDSTDQWIHHRETTAAGIQPARTENILPYHGGLRQLITSGVVLDTVSALLGETAVIYKEKINYKYPGGGGFAAHQDAPAYDYVDRHVTCMLAADAATLQSGCLHFSPYQQCAGLLPQDENGCIDPAVAEQLLWTPVSAEPGDALFFNSYVPHYSDGNQATRPRRMLYLTYNALSAGDFREQYYAEKRRTLLATAPDQPPALSRIRHFRGRDV